MGFLAAGREKNNEGFYRLSRHLHASGNRLAREEVLVNGREKEAMRVGANSGKFLSFGFDYTMTCTASITFRKLPIAGQGL